MTLSSYVWGSENVLARAAVDALVRRPDQSTLLYLAGGAGLGKTHLLKGLTARLQQHSATPEHILYVTAEGFARRVALHIRTGRMMAFRAYHRDVATLLIDDVRSIAGLKDAEGELCHTIEQIRARGGQVVLADRHAPAALLRLSEKIRTLVGEGQVITLQQPRRDTLARYVEAESARRGRRLDPTICACLVEEVLRDKYPPSGAVPLLAVALQHLDDLSCKAQEEERASWRARCATAARRATGSTRRQDDQGHTPDHVIAHTVKYFGITRQVLLSKRRDPWTVQARQIAMYLLCEDSGLGMTRTGRELCRDHSTVIHGHRQIERLVAAGDQETTDVLRDIRASLRGPV
jgi:chromosomal replication initiator protein